MKNFKILVLFVFVWMLSTVDFVAFCELVLFGQISFKESTTRSHLNVEFIIFERLKFRLYEILDSVLIFIKEYF